MFTKPKYSTLLIKYILLCLYLLSVILQAPLKSFSQPVREKKSYVLYCLPSLQYEHLSPKNSKTKALRNDNSSTLSNSALYKIPGQKMLLFFIGKSDGFGLLNNFGVLKTLNYHELHPGCSLLCCAWLILIRPDKE